MLYLLLLFIFNSIKLSCLVCLRSRLFTNLKVDSTESGLLFEIEPMAVAEMKPSFAKLPSTDAYATVSSEVGSLKHKHA